MGPAYAYLTGPLGAALGTVFGWWHVHLMRPRGTRVDGRDLPRPDDSRPALPKQPALPPVGIVALPRAVPPAPCEDAPPWYPGAVAGAAITPDASAVVTCGSSGGVQCHDLATGIRVWRFEGMLQEGRAVAISPDGQLVAACGSHEGAIATVHVLHARTGSPLRRLDLNDTTASLAWLPDNRHLLIGCAGEVRVWHVDEATEATSFPLPSAYGSWEEATCLAVDAEGLILIAGTGHSFEACVFALPDGDESGRFEGHQESAGWLQSSALRCVAVTPDGKLAVTGCNAGTARVWNVRTGAEICRFEGHAGWWGYRGITGVAFLPGGERALSACQDGTLCLWDARTGKELKRWDHGKGVRCLALSADGKLAVTGAWEGSVRIWGLG
jgi:WD40 repeat protein